MKKLKLAISVDDISPKNVNASLDDPFISKIYQIYRDHGIKTTLFVPGNLSGTTDLKFFPDWCKFIDDLEFVEVAGHGFLHDFQNANQTEDYKEFARMNYDDAIIRCKNIKESLKFFNKTIHGWKMPGWEFNPESLKAISENFDYLYPHPLHIDTYKNISQRARVIDSTNTYDIQHQIDFNILTNGILILHSHIDGETNRNKWTDFNFSRLQITLNDLFKFFEVETTFIKDL